MASTAKGAKMDMDSRKRNGLIRKASWNSILLCVNVLNRFKPMVVDYQFNKDETFRTL
jgi:hypothetical protein